MTLLIWSVKEPSRTTAPAISQVSRNRSDLSFPTTVAQWTARIVFQWSLVFPCCEYRCQLPAEGLAGAMSGSACLSKALAGWSELRGAGVGSMGDAWKVVGLFTFQLCLKLFWCFVWLSLMFSFCVTDSASFSLFLSLAQTLSPPTSLLSWIACLLPKKSCLF